MGRWVELAALPFVLLFVAAVHYVPHMPGLEPADAASALGELGTRVGAVLGGHDNPFPIHVDEHYYIAQGAAVDREGKVQYDEPYSGAAQKADLLSIGGLQVERGFVVLTAQLHQLTGIAFPALFRFLPMAWAAVIAMTLWAALRPAPGALPAAALVAILPTTVHFLGVGFLVPSAFNLAWIPATIYVVSRARGPGRLVATALLLTASFLMHLTVGVIVLTGALLTALVHRGTRADRLAMLGAILLPLLWLVPPLLDDAVHSVAMVNTLPFEASVFTRPGLALFALAAVGAFEAWSSKEERTAGRVLSALCFALAVLLAGSIHLGHHSDATYTRAVHAFFLTLAALAGLGLAAAALQASAGLAWLAQMRRQLPVAANPAPREGDLGLAVGGAPTPPPAPPRDDDGDTPPPSTGALQPARGPAPTPLGGEAPRGPRAGRALLTGVAGAVLFILAVSPALAAQLATPYYQVYDQTSWKQVEGFAHSGAGPQDTFLSDPWQAPVLSALTGAHPHTVLYPGAAPAFQEDWDEYLGTHGASAEWLKAHHIGYVIAPVAPNAPSEQVGPGVYRVLP